MKVSRPKKNSIAKVFEQSKRKSELRRIRNKVSLSGEWWTDKSHVLIDMDGTLIGQPGALFHNLFAVFALLRLSKLATFNQLIKAVKKTQTILLSQHNYSSNKEAFFETLASELRVKRAKVERFAGRFFDADYPFICLFLHSEPAARRLLDLLHSSNKHVTLATNAVFGKREIELRLKASDLYLHDFDLVTSWEEMNSTKPHSDFFTQTLQKIKVNPSNAIMIGNDPYYDLPAYKAGIDTLLVGKKLSLSDIADSLEEHLNTEK
jgi:FMN phosphatase YigB (HAD superfamily)